MGTKITISQGGGRNAGTTIQPEKSYMNMLLFVQEVVLEIGLTLQEIKNIQWG